MLDKKFGKNWSKRLNCFGFSLRQTCKTMRIIEYSRTIGGVRAEQVDLYRQNRAGIDPEHAKACDDIYSSGKWARCFSSELFTNNSELMLTVWDLVYEVL